LFVYPDPILVAERKQIAEFAVMFAFREFVDAGGLMSYGASLREMGARSLSPKDEARAPHGSPGGAKHRPDGASACGATVPTCLTGKSVRCLSSPIFKNIPVFD
jgi:hypothetical protein